ncbi:MAG: RidA family protein [Clostridiales bacterium]|nr:RidA family protein [Clostridiales bacterium]
MDKKPISSPNAPAAIGPYSQGIVSGRMIFTSGQLPADPETGAITGGIEEQSRRAIENLRAVLEEAGASLASVVKTTVFLKDMNDFAAFNAVYAHYFPQPYPARSCVQAARLPKDALLEIEAIAVL